jgi:hypothetical protein
VFPVHQIRVARLDVYCNVLFQFSVEHILDIIELVYSQANEGCTESLFYNVPERSIICGLHLSRQAWRLGQQ